MQEPFFCTLQKAAKEKRERDIRLGKITPPRNVLQFPDRTTAPVKVLPPIKVEPPRVKRVPITESTKEEKSGKPDRTQMLQELRAELTLLTKRFEAIMGEDDSPIVHPHPIKPIIRAVAAYYEIPVDLMLSDRRSRYIVRPRQVAMYLARTLTVRSLPALGRVFGKDHTSILNGYRRVNAMRQADPEMEQELDDITQLIRAAE